MSPRLYVKSRHSAWVPSAAVEMIVDLLRHGFVDALDGAQVRKTRARNRACRAEMQQQGLLALGADAGDLVQLRLADQGRALGAVRADDKAVGLVAQPLQEIEHRILGIEQERLAARQIGRASCRERVEISGGGGR